VRQQLIVMCSLSLACLRLSARGLRVGGANSAPASPRRTNTHIISVRAVALVDAERVSLRRLAADRRAFHIVE